jgi:hypothetical protein
VGEALPEGQGLLGRALAHAVSTGAGSAVEGAFYGLGQDVNEAALGDHDITAQSVLAHVGPMAAIGGGLGGLFGAAAEAVPAAFEKASEAIKSGAQKLKDAYPEFAERMSGGQVTADQVREVQAKLGQAFTNPKDILKLQNDLGDSLEGVSNAVADAQRRLYTEARPAETEALIRGPHTVELPGGGSAVEVVEPEKALAARDGVISTMRSALEEARQDPDLIQGRVVGEVEKILGGLEKRTASGDPVEIFENLRTARQQLDAFSSWAKVNRDLPPITQRNAVNLARSLRGAVRDTLTDVGTWGQAGARQAALDAAHSEYMGALEVLTKGKLGPLNANLIRKSTVNGQEVLTLNARALKTALNQAGAREGDAVFTAFSDYLDAAKKYVSEMDSTWQHVPSSEFDRGALESLIGKTGDVVDKARAQAEVTRALNDLSPQGPGFVSRGGASALLPPAMDESTGTGLGALAAAAVGQAVGAGPIAPLMGAYGAVKTAIGVSKTLKNVPQMVATLARLERISQTVSETIDRGAGVVVRGGARASSVGRAEIEAGIAREFAAEPDAALTRFNRRVAEIQRLSSDPNALHDALVEQSKHLDAHAPNTSQALSIASARTVSFLASKIPQDPMRGPLAPKWEPSQSEVARFSRYYEVAKDPLVVLKQAAAGTLTPEAVETVKACYPDLWAKKILPAIMDKLATPGLQVPAANRLSLSMLTGQDLDGRLGMLRANQATHQGPSRQQANQVPGAVRPTAGGLGKLASSSRMTTPMQASQQRDRRG